MSALSSFPQQLAGAAGRNGSLLCIGLDPLVERLPEGFEPDRRGALAFCQAIVDATADLVCAFKPQAAHFAALGGENELATLIDYIHRRHPGVPVILDAKRGDFPPTAKLYAREAFERYAADAVTANPFLGRDSLEPYLDYRDRGVFVLCRTSNPDSGWIQEREVDGEPIYLHIARAAAERWCAGSNVMLVCGATYPDALRRVRHVSGDMPILVPGVGSQSGDLEAVMAGGLDAAGAGLIVNSSRSILYAGPGADFAAAARDCAVAARDAINASRPSPVAAYRSEP